MEKNKRAHFIKPCWSSEYKGIKCLENVDSYGLFKSENDRRPSSCKWIKKPTTDGVNDG